MLVSGNALNQFEERLKQVTVCKELYGGKAMSEFTKLTKQAFDGYHDAPHEPAEWSLTDALGHIMIFLERHDSVDEMPGLRQAIEAMTSNEWENWRTRYPEHLADIIEPLQREIAH
jgi:hypothetical protein